jgi:hypothetical protein
MKSPTARTLQVDANPSGKVSRDCWLFATRFLPIGSFRPLLRFRFIHAQAKFSTGLEAALRIALDRSTPSGYYFPIMFAFTAKTAQQQGQSPLCRARGVVGERKQNQS